MIKLNIYVNNELAIPFIIETDGLSQDYIRGFDKLIELLPLTPVVIDLNEIGFFPELGDLWVAGKFKSLLNKEFVKIPELQLLKNTFLAFVKEDRVVWIMSFHKGAKYDGLKAALLSNPTIFDGSKTT